MRGPHIEGAKGLSMKVVDHSNMAIRWKQLWVRHGEVVGEDNESESSLVAIDDDREEGRTRMMSEWLRSLQECD